MSIKLKSVGEILRPAVKAIGQLLIVFVGILLIFSPFVLGVAFDRWEKWQNSYYEQAFREHRVQAQEDGGYAVHKSALTTYFPASKEAQTRTSLRFTPLKSNTFFPDSTAWSGITAWDYDSDGTWDEVFFCGYPKNSYGANSIKLGTDPKDWLSWEWSPCRYDAEHGVAMIDGCAIEHALDLVEKYQNM